MDHQMPADAVWENAGYSRSICSGDPDDLWGAIARMPGGELAGMLRCPPALHRFVNGMPKRV